MSDIQNLAHFNMVQQQIRPWNVKSPRLLKAISNIDRSLFLPREKQALAYVDTAIGLGDGVHMLEPKMAARLIQAANIQGNERVLLIGAGSGYVAALCSMLAYQLSCVDDKQSALDRAAKHCKLAGLNKIDFKVAQRKENALETLDIDRALGNQEFDAIIIRSFSANVPVEYFSTLSARGRLVAWVGSGLNIELMRYEKNGQQIQQTSLLDTQDVKMPMNATGGGQGSSFVF